MDFGLLYFLLIDLFVDFTFTLCVLRLFYLLFFYLRLLATACIELETKQQNITYSQTLTMHTFSLTEE